MRARIERAARALDGIASEPDVAAALAGVTVGAVTVYSIGIVQLLGAAIVLFVGAAIASALTKRFSAIFSAGIVLWLFSAIVTPRLAPYAPSENQYAAIGDMLRGAIVLGGCLLVAVAHFTGTFFRSPGESRRVRRFATATGVASAGVLVTALLVLPPLPAGSSFQITVPAGWTTYPPTTEWNVQTHSWNYWPEYCHDFAAMPATASLPTSYSDLGGAGICVAVVASGGAGESGIHGGNAAEGCYYGLDTGMRPASALYDWDRTESPASPPIAGAYEEIRVSKQGDTIYGLGMDHVRSVGPLLEHNCYIVSVLVPMGGTMSAGEANGILSTFRFR